jgi:hypothetical protein
VTGRDVIADGHRDTIDPQLGSRRERHSRYGDIIRGIEMNSGVFRRGKFGDFEEHVLRLPQ